MMAVERMRKMGRRASVAVIVGLLTATLTGCGEDQADTGTAAGAGSASEAEGTAARDGTLAGGLASAGSTPTRHRSSTPQQPPASTMVTTPMSLPPQSSPSTTRPVGDAVHGSGDAGRTQQARTTIFGDGTEFAWAASNFRLDRTSKPIITDNGIYAKIVDGQIIALDPATGQLRWSVTPALDEAMYHDPVLYGGVLYHLTPALNVVGRETATGSPTFRFAIKEGGTLTQPVIVDGKLIVAAGGAGGVAVVVDLATSETRTIPIGLHIGAASMLAAGDGKLFVTSPATGGTGSSELAAFDLATGAKLWAMRSDVVGAFTGNLLYADGVIFAGPTRRLSESRSPLAAIDAATGMVLWEGVEGTSRIGEPVSMSTEQDAIAYATGHLVMAVTGGVSVVDPRSGVQLWTAGLDQFEFFPSLYAGTPDYVVNEQGMIYTLLRSATGDEFAIVGLDVATGDVVSQVRTGIRALDTTGHSELSLIEPPAAIAAGGSTMMAWFEDARVVAGFNAPPDTGAA